MGDSVIVCEHSARSCSAAGSLSLKLMPWRSKNRHTALRLPPSLAHQRDDLGQRQVRLLGNQSQLAFRMLFERRDAAAAWLCPLIHPSSRKPFSNVATRDCASGSRARERAGLVVLQVEVELGPLADTLVQAGYLSGWDSEDREQIRLALQTALKVWTSYKV
jgi:hypothetical protein